MHKLLSNAATPRHGNASDSRHFNILSDEFPRCAIRGVMEALVSRAGRRRDAIMYLIDVVGVVFRSQCYMNRSTSPLISVDAHRCPLMPRFLQRDIVHNG